MIDDIIRKTFAGCLVLEKIGQGGMGIVYKAHHIKLNKVVCIKLLPKELETDQRNIDFFLREAEISKQLDHPNTVHVYDYGKENGRYYIVMSYVEGRSIEKIIQEKGAMNIEEASDIMIGIMKGLEHAHSKSIIHRDIKPSNIIITKDNIPRIIDFGLARRVVEEKQLTVTGEMIGTAYFMAPEQGLGNKVDARTDLYSAGATYFYMLTARYPFEGKSAIDVINQHINAPLPNLYMLKPELPIWSVKIIEKLMKKNPDERYQTATEVIKELEMYKATGYKNVIPSQINEITIDEIDKISQDSNNNQKEVLETKKNDEENKKNKELEKVKEEETPKITLQEEKTFVISKLINHSWLTFLSVISVILAGYFTVNSKIFSLMLLLFSLFALIKSSQKTKGSILEYLIYLTTLIISTYNFSQNLKTLSFIHYLTSYFTTFNLNKTFLLFFSFFTTIAIQSLNPIIKKTKYTRIITVSLFLIMLLISAKSIESVVKISITPTNFSFLIIIALLSSFIIYRYGINMYLIFYLINIFICINILKLPYISKQTEKLYAEEFKNYQIKIKEIEDQVKEEIYLSMADGNSDTHDVEEKIENEIKKRISQIDIPEKTQIKYYLLQKYNSTFVKNLIAAMGKISFSLALIVWFFINTSAAVRFLNEVKNR